jgi:hypothetical protein
LQSQHATKIAEIENLASISLIPLRLGNREYLNNRNEED